MIEDDKSDLYGNKYYKKEKSYKVNWFNSVTSYLLKQDKIIKFDPSLNDVKGKNL
jgi:hypothetical protein